MGGMEHTRSFGPVYTLLVEQRPSSGSTRGKRAYEEAVKAAARAAIPAPLKWPDIEVEIYYAARAGIVIDLDNVVRPTLNALTGCAYQDDRQVRSIHASSFDLTKSQQLFGNTDLIVALFKGGADHRVGIVIYSQRESIEQLWKTTGGRPEAHGAGPDSGPE